MQVKVNEVCTTSTNRQRADQVRRGKEGRVLAGGSAGDFRFGYRSAFIDDTWKDYNGRGPRPKKKVVIYDPEANVVRSVFRWLVDGMSLGAVGPICAPISVHRVGPLSTPITTLGFNGDRAPRSHHSRRAILYTI